jgi:hypothetical protein
VARDVPVISLTANKLAAALTCYPYALTVVLDDSGTDMLFLVSHCLSPPLSTSTTYMRLHQPAKVSMPV